MARKVTTIALAVVVIAIASGSAVWQAKRAQRENFNNASKSISESLELSDITYTMADVANHADGKSCWTTINGGVYDLTKWIPQHPGGPDKILGLCGKDGSAAFNGQHGGQVKQADVLASFRIGSLAK